MPIANRAFCIGLAAPFGSGCSTAATILEERLDFRKVRLSETLEKEYAARHESKRHDAVHHDLPVLSVQ